MKKPGIDLGLVFGAPKKGEEDDADGPSGDFDDLARTALSDGDMATRVDALHELIRMCVDEYGEAGEERKSTPPME